METEITRIAIIDDHHLFRESIETILSINVKYMISLQASNGKEFIRQLQHTKHSEQPNLVISDLDMPNMDGLEVALWLRKYCPRTKIVILSLKTDEVKIIQMIQAGIRAYLLKTMDGPDILWAINAVIEDGSSFQNWLPDIDSSNRPQIMNTHKLSKQAVKALPLLCAPLKNHEILHRLGIQYATLLRLEDELYDHFNVDSRIGLTLLYLKSI